MGCDIHDYYEIKNDQGKWELHNFVPKINDAETGDLETDYDALWNHPLHIGRCYRLFAFLADVRNGSGFAGCDTGDEVEPIDDPRGVPRDASGDYLVAVNDWSGDGHSHSFFTAEELVNADWDQACVERAFIQLSQLEQFKAQGNLDSMSYCGDVHGANVVKLFMDEAEEMLLRPETRLPGKSYYVRVEYSRPLKEELASYYTEWLPAVLKLHEDPTRIRFCFFFDN